MLLSQITRIFIMFRLYKGLPGYFKRRKLFQLMLMLVLIGGMILFYVTGYVQTGSPKNLFTVMAVLLALPLSKVAVILIAVFPYKRTDPQEFSEYRERLQFGQLMAELAITNPNLPTLWAVYAFVHAREVILYTKDRKGQKTDTATLKKQEDFISGILAAGGYQVNVKAFSAEDKFKNRFNDLTKKELNDEEELDTAVIARMLSKLAI